MSETPTNFQAELSSLGPKFFTYLDDDDLWTAINMDYVFQIVSSTHGRNVPGAVIMVKSGKTLISLPTAESFNNLVVRVYG